MFANICKFSDTCPIQNSANVQWLLLRRNGLLYSLSSVLPSKQVASAP